MSGNVWMFSDEIDDEDLEFMRHDYVTYNMACEYYRLGIKPVVRMAHEAGAVYKIRYELIEAHMRSVEGVTEELKACNPMEWVRQCNNIRNRVQEIVLSELVYV